MSAGRRGGGDGEGWAWPSGRSLTGRVRGGRGRTSLDLYANVIHCQSLPGVETRHRDIDILIVRENTEGEYSSLEHEVTAPGHAPSATPPPDTPPASATPLWVCPSHWPRFLWHHHAACLWPRPFLTTPSFRSATPLLGHASFGHAPSSPRPLCTSPVPDWPRPFVLGHALLTTPHSDSPRPLIGHAPSLATPPCSLFSLHCCFPPPISFLHPHSGDPPTFPPTFSAPPHILCPPLRALQGWWRV